MEQHQQAVSGKRLGNFEAEHDNTSKRQRVDSSEDGEVDSSDDEEQRSAGVDEVEGRRKEADHTECCTIQSLVRTGRNTRGGKDGNLLKAESDGEEKISVEFTGTDPKNDASVFHLEACDDIDGNVLRYSVKNDNYYLRVYRNGRVKLRKLVNFPTNVKYFFSIKSVGRIVSCPVTFKSLKTDEYLHCDKDGNAFMKEVTASDDHGQPKDRQTWFCCHRTDHSPNQATVSVQQENTNY